MSKKTKKRHPARRRRGRIVLCILLIVAVLVPAAVAVFLAPYASARMDLSLLDIPAAARPATLYAYDPANRATRQGELHPAHEATLASPERRIPVTYDDLPEHLIHAFVAIEDKRFYRHSGVDLLRTAHAGVRYLLGSAEFGGSTITQQLVKNLTGRDEATADRKLTEIFLALDLERHIDKETVLESYLNIINLAEGCRGVGAAARRYYSKTPAELTLPECATIAAITNNPARYDPITHPADNRARRDLILREMAEQGYITPAERDVAIATELSLVPGDFTELDARAATDGSSESQGIASWYADMVAADVIRDLVDRLGYSRTLASQLVYSGGLTVETAMDEDLQAVVEAYYADVTNFPAGESGQPASAFILIDPMTGDILAVAGAIGEKSGNRLQNYATDTRRPAGSCLKPLSVYAPALEDGLVTWATVFEDAPLREQNGAPWPRNADGLYRGHMTVGGSVADSVNTVAVRLLETVGLDRSFTLLHDRLGLNGLVPAAPGVTDHDRTVSSLALGQQSYGVTTRDLTAAYTALCGGIYRPAVSYHRVLDREGRVLLENPRDSGVRVFSETTAALVTRMLQTVTDHGTASRQITLDEHLGIEVAGKTGTTQNNCDRRFVGYTPRLLAGAWMGYDYPAELRGIYGNPCIDIWDQLMTACESAYRGAPPRLTFDLPDELMEVDICPHSGALAASDCPVTEHAWFVRGTEPAELCPLHEEPPIVTVPPDPGDPDRIPLLPDDLTPAPTPAPTPEPLLPQAPTRGNWLTRWFGRGRGRR